MGRLHHVVSIEKNTPAMHLQYRPEIDGLRALAIVLVLVFHIFPSWMGGGFIGVDVFFVISGYLISRAILAELRSGQFSFIAFYVRRVNRLFPALIVVLASCLILGGLVLFSNEYKSLGRSTAAGAGFLANINAYAEIGYWDVASKFKPLLHLWSLGVEEQFYFVFPCLLWMAWMTRTNPLAMMLACTIASGMLVTKSMMTDQPAAFYLPMQRAWELLVGAMLASTPAFRASRTVTTDRTRHVVALIGLGMILFAAFGYAESATYPPVWSLLPVGGAALLIAAGSKAWVNRVIFSNRFFVYVGRISYPLYLWHWPLLSFTYIVDGGSPSYIALGIVMLVSIVLASATYHLVEKPLRRSPCTQGKRAVGTMVVLAALGGLGYTIFKLDGIPSRPVENYQLNDLFTIQRPPVIQEESNGCFKALPALFKTQLQKGLLYGTQVHCLAQRIEDVSIALIGDSNAGQYAKDLTAHYGTSLLTIHSSGRPYIKHINHDEVSQEILSFLTRQNSIKTVILGHLGVGIAQGYAPTLSRVQQLTHIEYESGLKQTIQILQAAGKRVIWLGSIPILDFDPKRCHTRPFSLKKVNERCTIPRIEIGQTHRPYLQVLQHMHADMPDLEVVDAMDYLCDIQVCYAKKEGVVLYADTKHLNQYGSAMVTGAIIKAIGKNN